MSSADDKMLEGVTAQELASLPLPGRKMVNSDYKKVVMNSYLAKGNGMIELLRRPRGIFVKEAEVTSPNMT
jgi:hypothetical protein